MARKQSSPVKYAPKVDIFGNLVNSFDKNARQMERSGIRDIQQGQFAEGMGLKRDVFAEKQKQNQFTQEMQNKRYGLAAANAAFSRAQALKNPSWYEKQRQLHLWGLEDIDAQGKYKGKGKGTSFGLDDIIKFADTKDLSPTEVGDMKDTYQAAVREGLTGEALKNQVYSGFEPNGITTWGDNFTKPLGLEY